MQIKKIVNMEKKFWEADMNKDADFYRKHTTDNSIAVGTFGVANKKMILKTISANQQKLLNYFIKNPKVLSLNKNTALLTYKAVGETLLKGKKSKFSMLATSMYVKAKGKWLAAFHQNTPFK